MAECPNCKGTLIEIKHDSSITYKCTHCNYSVVTSNIDLICEDETEYSIILLKDNEITKNTVSIIKKLSGLTTSKVVSIIRNGEEYPLYNGAAYDIRSIIQKLNKENIKFKIEPDFHWK